MTSHLETPFAVDLAGPDDHARLQDVFQAAFAVYVSRIGRRPAPLDRNYRRLLEDNFVLKLSERGEAVGFAALLPQRAALYLDAIAIQPTRQRLGGGRLLIAQAETLASELCLPSLQLHTPARAGPLAFYRALGFHEVEREGRGANAFAQFEKPVRTALDAILKP